MMTRQAITEKNISRAQDCLYNLEKFNLDYDEYTTILSEPDNEERKELADLTEKMDKLKYVFEGLALLNKEMDFPSYLYSGKYIKKQNLCKLTEHMEKGDPTKLTVEKSEHYKLKIVIARDDYGYFKIFFDFERKVEST